MSTSAMMSGGNRVGSRQQRAAALRREREAVARLAGISPADSSAAVGPESAISEAVGPESAIDSYAASASSQAVGPESAIESPAAGSAAPAALDRQSHAATVSPLDGGPVGQGDHVVEQGECISSIAGGTGHFWETIWNDPANAGLRQARPDPNILLPGDRVTIPPRRTRSETRPAERRHRFRRRGEPTWLRLRVLHRNQPRANAPYALEIDGQRRDGTTDADGRLEELIPAGARRGTLTVGDAPDRSVYPLQLGALDPIDSVDGVTQRLSNLGFDCESGDGPPLERARAALCEFQRAAGLTESGEADGATRARLLEQHGS